MSTRASILIVDDEASNRRLLEVLLGPEGYCTRTAAGGREALDSIATDPPDLILLDVMMPGIDGRQVATIIKADPATRNIPIIMVTAQTDREARLAALDAGAEEFLNKPVDRAELWLRVRNLLRLKELSDLLEEHRDTLEAEVRVRTADLEARTADLQRFRTALDVTGDAIVLVNRTTMRFVEVNATASTMLGYSRDELFHLGPMDLVPSSRAELETLFDAIIAAEGRTESVETVQRKDGSTLPAEVHRHAQRTGDEWIVIEVLRDITERTDAVRRLQYLAHFDPLTGLLNRTLFRETLTKTLVHATANRQTVAVIFVDLDNFKDVNDTLGHGVGDELLIQVSTRLSECVRVRDIVGRLGGDEFGLILMMPEGHNDAAHVAEKIQRAVREPFSLAGRELSVTASIGITVHPADGGDTETLLQYADTAMYQAKHAGRDTYRFFTREMNLEVLRRLELEAALRRAVSRGEFVLHYQPKVQLDTGCVVGLEALLRWDRPGFGLTPPGEFITALEDSGLIVEVGSWVIATVCQQLRDWMRRGIQPLQVSVNVSARQFALGDLEGDVLRGLDANAVPGGLLELELTESLLMTNADAIITVLENLKAAQVQISIDDFGTGYSSLAYLRRFPIDKLKIDRSFITKISQNPRDAAIALAIIQMGHSLDLTVIAEGVETAGQLAYLRAHRCDEMQGFYYSPPLPVPALEQLLLAGTRLTTSDDGTVVPLDDVVSVG